MKKEWTICKYSDKDQKNGIIDLRKLVFKDEDPDKENTDFWNWEFEENYAGHANIYLAVSQQHVVGHYAVCPSKIFVDHKEKKGSIVVDVMTHPDYRYQGMFTTMGEYSLNDSGRSGIDFSYGFPIRKGVMPGHLKIGWKIAFELPVYVYPVNFSDILKKFIPGNVLPRLLGMIPQCLFQTMKCIRKLSTKKCTVRSADKFEKTGELEQFIKKTKDQHRIMQCRDYEFLDWRYNTNRYRKYKIFFAYRRKKEMSGYVVLRETVIYGLKCVTVIDIQALDFDKNVINSLLDCAGKYAVKCGAALVGCMINNNAYRRQMLKNFYIKSPYIFKFIVHKNRDIDYENLLLEDKNWFLTWADTDDL